MTDSNRVQLGFLEESVWGETPTSGTLQLLPITDETFSGETNTGISNRLRSDRQVASIAVLGESASGDVNFEMLADEDGVDVLFKQVFQSSGWSMADTTTGSTTITGTDTVNSTGAFTNMIEGQWFRLRGPGLVPGNTGYFQIETKTSNDEVVVGNDVSLTNEVAPAAIIDTGGMIRNGVEFGSNTIQRQNTALTDDYHIYRGCSPNTFNATVAPADFMSGSFSFVCKGEESRATPAVAGTPADASGSQSLTSSNNVDGIYEGTGLTALDISNLSLTIDNALAPRNAVGSRTPVSLRSGRLTVSGTLEAYYADRTLYEKAQQQVDSRLSFRMEDAAVAGSASGNSRIFTFPRIRYTDRSANPGGLDSDVIAQMGWTAYAHEDFGTIQMDRFPSVTS